MNSQREAFHTRREWLKLGALGLTGSAGVGWFRQLADHARAAAPPGSGTSRPKSCILLWMGGGPSQLDTFDMKPGTPHAGEFRPIATNVPGIQVCEHLPRLACLTDRLALLRGMSTGEADHRRASYFLQTGYAIQPGTNHPLLGSLVAADRDRPDAELPNFFWLNSSLTADAGYLGARHAPIYIGEVREQAERNLECSRPSGSLTAFEQKLGLLNELEEEFQRLHGDGSVVADHRAVYQQTARLMRSGKRSALDLFREPLRVREAYGTRPFGQAALLARRLVEVGVPFVGIGLGDWDTHNDNWSRLRPLLADVDRTVSALLLDLETRGLLASTLVVWMGEFGRDPRISGGARPGRDHYAKAWTTVLAGAGLKTGQVIGNTGKTGLEVEDRPIRTNDFLATICQALDVDFSKKYTTPDGRPIRVVAEGAKPVAELFG